MTIQKAIMVLKNNKKALLINFSINCVLAGLVTYFICTVCGFNTSIDFFIAGLLGSLSVDVKNILIALVSSKTIT